MYKYNKKQVERGEKARKEFLEGIKIGRKNSTQKWDNAVKRYFEIVWRLINDTKNKGT